MANARRGEVPLTLNGIDFVLKFDMNAFAELEGALGESLATILEGAENKMSFRFIRAAFYAAVVNDPRFKHRKLTLEKIGTMITMENYAEITKAVVTALTSALSGKTPDEISATLPKGDSDLASEEGAANVNPSKVSTGISTV